MKPSKVTLLLLLLVFLLTIQQGFCQRVSLQSDSLVVNRYLLNISDSNLYKHILILSSNAFSGRKMGEIGMDSAANYIANEFYNLGLQRSLNNQYNQPFTIFDWYYKSQSITNGYGKVNILPAWAGSLQDTTELIFVGNGLESDYNGVQVKGKMAAYYYVDSPGSTSKESQPIVASENGAKYSIAIHKSEETFKKFIDKSHAFSPRASLEDKGNEQRTARFFNILEKDYLELYNPEHQELIAQYYEKGRLSRKNKKALSQKVYLNLEYQTRAVQASNIIGIIEGSDLKDEVIVLSAHYDHLGTQHGEIFNGADDNASGTSALLEMARVFMMAKEEGNGPRRTIVFAEFSAEEEGLLGAEYYVNNPIYPLDKTIANLNFDMIGRVNEINTSQPNYVYLIGSGQRSEEIYQINELSQRRFLPELRLDYTYDDPNNSEQLYKRSDQYHFIKNNIPALFYTDMMKKDYHKPTDTAEKITLKQLKLRTQLGVATAWELANRD